MSTIDLSFLTTYIEVLAGLLIFGVTLPSILISVSPRMRALRKKHPLIIRFKNRNFTLYNSISSSHTVIVIVVSITILVSYFIPTPTFICNINNKYSSEIGCWLRDQFIHYASFTTSTILLLNILLVSYFFMILRSYSKDQFLAEIERECRYNENKERVDLNNSILESVSELGQYCEAGSDKDAVLETLFNLTKISNLSRESRVKLAQSVREVVKGGDANNFRYALKILQEMYDEASKILTPEFHKPVPSHNLDIVSNEFRLSEILDELENVLVLAFTLNNTDVRTTMFETYGKIAFQPAPAYAYSFLRLGKVALLAEDMESALIILGKFHTKIRELISSKNTDNSLTRSDREALTTFFGLVSYFWYKQNTARHIAYDRVKIFASTKNLDSYLQNSKKSFERDGDIETVDHLEQMLYEYNQFEYVIQFLQNVDDLNTAKNEAPRERIALHYPNLKELRLADYEGIRACGVSETATNALLQKIKSSSVKEDSQPTSQSHQPEEFWGGTFRDIKIGIWKKNRSSS